VHLKKKQSRTNQPAASTKTVPHGLIIKVSAKQFVIADMTLKISIDI